MVLSARPLSSCCIRPIYRALSTTTAAACSVRNARSYTPLRADLTSRAALAYKSSPSTLFNPPSLRVRASTRLLTTQREKVKVLLVLYDGGKHAQEVSNKKKKKKRQHTHCPIPSCRLYFSSSYLLLQFQNSPSYTSFAVSSQCRFPPCANLSVQ